MTEKNRSSQLYPRSAIRRTYDEREILLPWRQPPTVTTEEMKVGPSMLKLRAGRPYCANFKPPFSSIMAISILKDAGFNEDVNRVLNTKHRSWITKDTLHAATLKYSQQKYPPSFTDDILESVIDELKADFGRVKKPLITVDLSVKKMPQGTSAGLPYAEVRSINKGEAWLYDSFRIKNMHARIRRGHRTRMDDCASFAKSNISSKDKNKVRLIWCYPLSMVALEGKYAYPILEAVKRQEIGQHIAYGAETTLGGCEWLYKELCRLDDIYPNSRKIIMDYSSFDQTPPPWLVRRAFDILECALDFTRIEDEDGRISNIPLRESLREWKAIKNYFINTPVRMTDGIRYVKTGGVPSGSCFTNLIDSVINMIVTRYTFRAVFNTPPVFEVYLGDDVVTAVPRKTYVDMEYLSEVIDFKFNMKVNTDKTYTTSRNENVQFLGYNTIRGQPLRAFDELLSALLLPDITSEESVTELQARTIGVALASGGCSEKILQMCEHILFRLYRKSFSLDFFDEKILRRVERQLGWSVNFSRYMTSGIVLPKSMNHLRNLVIPLTTCAKIEKKISLVKPRS